MFKFFEGLTPPYPPEEPTQPPGTLFAFVWHYCSGLKRYLGLMAITSATYAFLEVLVYGFMGQLVDWLTGLSRDSFIDDRSCSSMGII